MPALTVVVLLLAAGCRASDSVAPADLILYDAVIYTANDRQPHVEAVAITDGRFVVVGTNADALARKGPSTRLINARTLTGVPGLHDAHGHFRELGESLQMLKLRGTTSFDQVVDMVRERAAVARPGEWILGRNWDQNDWTETVWPTHDKLTAVAPHNPVYLTRIDGHAALVNKAAMLAAGLLPSTADPDGGRIIRDASGAPSGVLIDQAQYLVRSHIPQTSNAQHEEQILLADAEASRVGLTMVHDALTSARDVAAYKRLIDAGRLKTRLYVMLGGSHDEVADALKNGPLINHARGRLSVRAVKILADGALGSRGAALLEPYADEPGNAGLLTTPQADVHAMTLAAARAGFQACVHAIGDRANRQVLDTFEKVVNELPSSRNLRQRIEHAQVLDEADIPRFAKLNVIASMQATHATSDMPWVETRLGPARAAEGAYVWQKLTKSGTVIANGSDFPVEDTNPMTGFYASITRQDPAGRPPGGWMPDERLSRTEALKTFTWNAAFAAHAEAELGSIEVGKYADMVLVDHDLMTAPAPDILKTSVHLTIIGGEVVYENTRLKSGGTTPDSKIVAGRAFSSTRAIH